MIPPRLCGKTTPTAWKEISISKIRNAKARYQTTFVLMLKLRELKPGESAVIVSIDDSELLLKLMEMGCVPGEKIKVEKVAPLGDPISILVAGYSLSLRLNEAELIRVERIGSSITL